MHKNLFRVENEIEVFYNIVDHFDAICPFLLSANVSYESSQFKTSG